jgi:hypothetical protein
MAIQFYDNNTINVEATYTFTSATNSLSFFLYDENRLNKLTSLGSNDSTDEVYQINYSESKTFDAIHIDNHNVKAGKIEYWNGSSWMNFSTPITYSGETESTHFHIFNSVSTTAIRLTMNTTQTVNSEKYVGQLRAISLLGEVSSNPSEFDPNFYQKRTLNETATGKTVSVNFGESYRAEYFFTDANSTDVTLFESLKNRTDSFYVYNCGGVSTFTDLFFRLQDIFRVTLVNDFKPRPKSNILNLNSVYVFEVEGA